MPADQSGPWRVPQPTEAGRTSEHEPPAESVVWNITATMLSGVLAFGLPGWWLARWLDQQWVTGLALLLGMGLALTLIWFRYGTSRS